MHRVFIACFVSGGWIRTKSLHPYQPLLTLVHISSTWASLFIWWSQALGTMLARGYGSPGDRLHIFHRDLRHICLSFFFPTRAMAARLSLGFERITFSHLYNHVIVWAQFSCLFSLVFREWAISLVPPFFLHSYSCVTSDSTQLQFRVLSKNIL